jgi:zinc protease
MRTIREELGGTYTISASQSSERIPRPEYSVSIAFGCDPARTDMLVKRVFAEIESLRNTGPTDSQVADVKAALQRDFENRKQQVNFLVTQILSAYESNEDPARLWEYPSEVGKLDGAAIQQAARTYLNVNNYVRITLLPEKRSAQGGK